VRGLGIVSGEQTVVRRPPEAGGVGFVNPEVVRSS
jgi:hypothetical protein